MKILARLVLLTLTVFLVHQALSAPAPFKQAAKKPMPALVGTWNMFWCFGDGTVVFHPNGGYECQWYGGKWIGSWEVKDGVLTVQEGISQEGISQEGISQAEPSWYLWRVVLDNTGLAGRTGGGDKFALTPRVEQLHPPRGE